MRHQGGLHVLVLQEALRIRHQQRLRQREHLHAFGRDGQPQRFQHAETLADGARGQHHAIPGARQAVIIRPTGVEGRGQGGHQQRRMGLEPGVHIGVDLGLVAGHAGQGIGHPERALGDAAIGFAKGNGDDALG